MQKFHWDPRSNAIYHKKLMRKFLVNFKFLRDRRADKRMDRMMDRRTGRPSFIGPFLAMGPIKHFSTFAKG